jgi:hypothetical protein
MPFDSFNLEIFTPPYDPGTERFAATTCLSHLQKRLLGCSPLAELQPATSIADSETIVTEAPTIG